MNIEHRGIRISGLPADLIIETSQGKIEIRTEEVGFAFSPEQATEVRDALTEALNSLGAESGNLTGPWMSLRDVPASIDMVYDCDGDRCRRSSERDSGWSDVADLDDYDRKYSSYTLTRG